MENKTMFTHKGNGCGDRVRVARALHKPPLTQEMLARKVQLLGLQMTKAIISRIETGERRVTDIELKILSIAVGQSLDWMLEEYYPHKEAILKDIEDNL